MSSSSGAVALALLVVACKEPPRPQRATPVVATDTVRKGPLPYIVVANGEVEPNRVVAVQAQVSGMLTTVSFSEGDEVSRGQVLFQIDPRPFRTEVARVQGALSRDQAQLARARSDSTRFAALAKDGYVTQQQLDQTFAEVSAFAATVDADRAALDAARLALSNSTVRAPISGRTGQLSIKAGNLVAANSQAPLVTINEVRPVLVRFTVPERDFEEMRRRSGMDAALAVRVTPNVGESPRTVSGTLTFIDNVVDRATGSVLLKARMANEDRALWPGQFVTVGLELNVDTGAVTVPTVAVVTTAAGAFVYTVGNDMKARRVPVRLGRQSGTITKIDSGLQGGEQIVVDGQSRLTDGSTIEIRGALATTNEGRGAPRGDTARTARLPGGTQP